MTQNSHPDPIGQAKATYLRAKLQPFFDLNPEADFRTDDTEYIVGKPWGEEGIEIPFNDEDEELFEALNAIRLPPRFTAIWHEDTQDFEVIHTVLPKRHRLLQREFTFRYRDQCYRCRYGSSSSRLTTIARRVRPSGSAPPIDFRNLQLFNRFHHYVENHPESAFTRNGKPTSFWISGIDGYDDDHIGDLVRNLNFHMSYFDRSSPNILIHEESADPSEIDALDRAEADCFPETVSGQDIHQHLLVLWASANSGDPFLRFIQYYQILEYAGFYHVKDKVRREVERAIVAPDAAARPDKVAQQLLDAIAEDKRPDDQKINAMIDECVDPREMWEILDGSLADFSEEAKLDGGFVLPALVSASTDYEGFASSWNRQFSSALHRVRNALVHARESRQSTMIAPTTANHARLSRWLLPLSETAARVMLYSRL